MVIPYKYNNIRFTVNVRGALFATVVSGLELKYAPSVATNKSTHLFIDTL